MNLDNISTVDELLRQGTETPMRLPDVQEYWNDFELLWSEQNLAAQTNPVNQSKLHIAHKHANGLISILAASLMTMTLTGADKVPGHALEDNLLSPFEMTENTAIKMNMAIQASITTTQANQQLERATSGSNSVFLKISNPNAKAHRIIKLQSGKGKKIDALPSSDDIGASAALSDINPVVNAKHEAGNIGHQILPDNTGQTIATSQMRRYEIGVLPPKAGSVVSGPLPALDASAKPVTEAIPSLRRIRWAAHAGIGFPPLNMQSISWRVQLGVSGRFLLNSNGWFVQGETWLTQFQSPKITLAHTTHEDLDNERITKVSIVMPEYFRGFAIGGMVGKNWRTGTSAYAGVQNTLLLSTYAYTENAFYTGRTTPPSEFMFASNKGVQRLPAGIHPFDAALKLGVEQYFGKHWLAGLSLLQGITDLTDSRIWNTHSDWLLYCGYRF